MPIVPRKAELPAMAVPGRPNASHLDSMANGMNGTSGESVRLAGTEMFFKGRSQNVIGTQEPGGEE